MAVGWRPFFEGPQAPFSWEPDQVEVLPDGTLALSTGPVRDTQGRLIGRFTSICLVALHGLTRKMAEMRTRARVGRSALAQ